MLEKEIFSHMDVHEWHCNTPINKLNNNNDTNDTNDDYCRLSVVCYLRKINGKMFKINLSQ